MAGRGTFFEIFTKQMSDERQEINGGVIAMEAVLTAVHTVWGWLVRFFGSAVMIFSVATVFLVFGESLTYRAGRARTVKEEKMRKKREARGGTPGDGVPEREKKEGDGR